MSFLRAALAIAAKDLRVELRSRDLLYTAAFFAALVILLGAFALTSDGETNRPAGPGVLWIAIALSGTLALGRAFDRERERDTLRALLLSPAPRAAIYLGKLVAVTLLLWLVAAVAAPLTGLLFGAPLGAAPLPLLLLLALGGLGFASVGSLFSAMLLGHRARDLLLGVLLYPIAIPVLIAAARGTAALWQAPPDLPTAWLWIRLLALFDLVFLTAALWLFEPLVSVE